MVTRLLNLCGLYLGPESDLTPPSPSNADGHWENVRFVAINDELLGFFDAGWDYPPTEDVDWEVECAEPLRSRAKELVTEFAEREPWGWKDPRNSLTLPFWMKLVPNLKVVIPLRNPLEVAASLYKRGTHSRAFSMHLWLTYHERLLRVTEPHQRLFTHFDAYFVDAPTELSRLVQFLDMCVPEATLRHACAAAAPQLRHNRAATNDLATVAPPAVHALYQRLCDEARWPQHLDLEVRQPSTAKGMFPPLPTVAAQPVDNPAKSHAQHVRSLAEHAARQGARWLRQQLLRVSGIDWAIETRDARILELRRQLEEQMAATRAAKAALASISGSIPEFCREDTGIDPHGTRARM
jgi:hypothetical protein